jgi:translation initiation factor 1 (eIF-1/SUI1)
MNPKTSNHSALVYSTNPHAIRPSEEEDEVSLSPSEQTLWVFTDNKKRGGKIVTVVNGFRGNSADLEALAKLLKNKCGTGGSAKDGEIIIQGDNKQKIIELLKQAGYHAKAK